MKKITNLQLSKYFTEDGQEVSKKEKEVVDPAERIRKGVKEISVGVLDINKASGLVAKALIKALKRADLDVLEVDHEPENTIFNNVKIISSEAINSPDFDIESIEENDVILTDKLLPSTHREEMFRAVLKDKGVKAYTSIDHVKNHILDSDGFIEAVDVNEVNEPGEESDSDGDLKVLYKDDRIELIYDTQKNKYITIGG